MPSAGQVFRPFDLWNGRSATILDITRTSAEQLLASAEALTAPAEPEA